MEACKLRDAAQNCLRLRRLGGAGSDGADDVAAVLRAARRSTSAMGLAEAARDLALAGVASRDVFAELGALVDGAARPKTAAEAAAARAWCGLADLRLEKRTWARLGGSRRRPWDSEALVALWEYSKSRKKVTQSPGGGGDDGDDAWPPRFADESLPLVLDVGCGFGVSPFALAARTRGVNVLAVDRARHALLYGRALVARRGLGGRCVLAAAAAEDALHWCRLSYGGPVECVLFQFPTPPALAAGRNAQLPSAASKYMCAPKVLDLAARAGTP